jgi:S-adenosylmethionine-diacylglycerol 3-amino-3-carboxypropyl transferase
MNSEAKAHADFSYIRYGQCWEDADVLLEALDPRPRHTCLSIASAGDNTLALLARNPERVIAIDLSPTQLWCLELRVAAFRELEYKEVLELIGSAPSQKRRELYRRCRRLLSADARSFWDSRLIDIDAGIGNAGKFERYFALFRERFLPLIHSRKTIASLLEERSIQEREEFYERKWNTWRWRLMFKVFFSRLVMGRFGRDPNFFKYVEGSVASRILDRARYALTALDPCKNSYLQWILAGHHITALPFALREENFLRIRSNLDRLEWRCQSVEEFITSSPETKIDRFNLSDIFEYTSSENYHRMLEILVRVSRSNARLAYWNMLAPRRRPEAMASWLRPLTPLAERLHSQDRAFFYSAFVVEEVI